MVAALVSGGTGMSDQDAGGQIIIENKVLAAGFVQVPVVVLRDPDLSAGAKLAYGALCWYAWKAGTFPGIDAMAADFGMGNRSAIRYLSELENRGYIEVTRPRLGKRNTYVLPDVSAECQSGTRASANLALQGCQSGTSLERSQDSTTHTLSHSAPARDLTDAFFAAIGEQKPAAKRRERAVRIIDDLTAEGFDADAIREACKLAGERGARGPDLLPYLAGEAAEIVARRGQARKRAEKLQEAAATADQGHRPDTSAVEALSASERARYEQQAREALRIPPERDSDVVRGAVEGWIAARLESGGR